MHSHLNIWLGSLLLVTFVTDKVNAADLMLSKEIISVISKKSYWGPPKRFENLVPVPDGFDLLGKPKITVRDIGGTTHYGISNIFPQKTELKHTKIVRAGVPSSIWFIEYEVGNCSNQAYPIDDTFRIRYKDFTEVSFERTIQREQAISAGFTVALTDLTSVTGSVSETLRLTELQRQTFNSEREITDEKTFRFSVPPKTKYTASYLKETSGDFFNFTVSYVVEADVSELKNTTVARSAKFSEIVPPETERTFAISGSVRNVLGGNVKTKSSDRHTLPSDESCRDRKPTVNVKSSPGIEKVAR
jgi:hypothetical protein